MGAGKRRWMPRTDEYRALGSAYRYLDLGEPVFFAVFVPDAVDVVFADVSADFIAVFLYKPENRGVAFGKVAI